MRKEFLLYPLAIVLGPMLSEISWELNRYVNLNNVRESLGVAFMIPQAMGDIGSKMANDIEYRENVTFSRKAAFEKKTIPRNY